MEKSTPTQEQITSFVEALEELPDKRDNRGKRHTLSFIITSVVLSLLVGRSTTSSIFRYIRNKIGWLREVTGKEEASPISRAHLPRLLEKLDCEELNKILELSLNKKKQFHVKI